MKTLFKWLPVVAISGLLLTGCSGGATDTLSGSGAAATDRTQVSILWAKTEVLAQFEAMVDAFNAYQDTIFVTSLPGIGGGMGPQDVQFTLMASGDAATITHMAPYIVFEFDDTSRDLRDELFVSLADEGTLDPVTRADGRVVGMPSSVEGFGFIYNLDVIEAALGRTFDASVIRTIGDVRAVFEELEAAGQPALIISNLGWSMGWHFANKFLASQSTSYEDNLRFLEALVAGEVDLYSNPRYQGWLEMFRLMSEFNVSAHAPLDPDYDDGIMALADGDVAFWFQGNWTYPVLNQTSPGVTYGFMPVPLSNDPQDFGNSHISVGVPHYFVIDASQNSLEQQEAAMTFLHWMIQNPTGQHHMVNELALIPVFDGFDIVPDDALATSIMAYSAQGNTMAWIMGQAPPGMGDAVWAYMQQYMLGLIDAQTMTRGIEDFFIG